MTILYANPYNIDANGFQFSSVEEFTQKAAALRDRFGNPVEEFELDYIEGDDGALFRACGIDQTNLSMWFDAVGPLDEHQKAALFYLCDCIGYRLSEALDKLDDVSMYEGDLIDAATELFDDVYLSEVPEAVRNYIDYNAFARDCQLSGDMHEFRLDGTTWSVTNAGEV
jgi:hypothetical protein